MPFLTTLKQTVQEKRQLMPENWKTYKLKEVALLKRGYDLPSRLRKKGSYDIISSSGVTDRHEEYKIKGPGVVTGRYGTIGKVFYTESNFWPLNTSLYVKDFKGNDPKFIYYFLQTLNWNKYSTKSAVPGVDRNEVHQEKVVIPKLTEQKSIASILSALDDKIELNLRMNKTLEEMAMALYKHWFVDFGPFQDGEFVDSELGEIPKGWEVKTVQDFGKVITGKTPSKKFPEHFGEEIAFVTPTDFKNYGKHITTAARKISKSGIEKHKNSILPENSIIVTCIGSDMGKVAVNKVRCLTNQQINSLITEHYLYLYLFFKSNYNLLKMLAGDGTTMPIINKTSFQNIKVILPLQNILKEFESQIQQWDEQMHLNSIENQTLTQLRDTLLPKLISGEVRVKDVEKTLSEVL